MTEKIYVASIYIYVGALITGWMNVQTDHWMHSWTDEHTHRERDENIKPTDRQIDGLMDGCMMGLCLLLKDTQHNLINSILIQSRGSVPLIPKLATGRDPELLLSAPLLQNLLLILFFHVLGLNYTALSKRILHVFCDFLSSCNTSTQSLPQAYWFHYYHIIKRCL